MQNKQTCENGYGMGYPEYAKIAEINGKQLWIGSLKATQDKNFLINNKIGAIVNVCGGQIKPASPVNVLNLIDLEDLDVSAAPMNKNNLKHVEKAFSAGRMGAAYIQSSFQKGHNVLVNCAAGINRSAFTIAMFLVLHQGYSADNAIKTVRIGNSSRVPNTLCNKTFIKIIGLASDKLKNKTG